MISRDDLPLLTDATTIGRGVHYANVGRVHHVVHNGGTVSAVVTGSTEYTVRLSARAAACTCPVDGFCKHCVALVVALEDGDDVAADPDGAGAGPDPVRDWLHSLPHGDLLDLLDHAVDTVPDLRDVFAQAYLAATGDVEELAELVESALKPRRSFYDYRAADRYASDAEGAIQSIEDAAANPSSEVLKIVERAITLAVRTILKSDDSSGSQGGQITRLLDAHLQVANGLAADLAPKERRRLATWLHKFRFDGKQDFFEVDVDRYAPALGDGGVAHYATLVEKSCATLTPEQQAALTDRSAGRRVMTGHVGFAVQYARERLAILSRDPEQIVTALGGEPTSQHHALNLVAAFDDARLPRFAVRYAEIGVAMGASHRHGALVDRLVRDATERGDLDAVATLRWEHLAATPSSGTMTAWRTAARAAGTLDPDSVTDAEAMLRERAPWDLLHLLLAEGRDDEMWELATTEPMAVSTPGHRPGDQSGWERVLQRRAQTRPAETLPRYRELVAATLSVTDKRSYRAAAGLLATMRDVAAAAGTEHVAAFEAFRRATVDDNRHRPNCMEAFRRQGLIPG